MVKLTPLCLLASIGCGSDAPAIDASPAAVACDPAARFGPPVPIQGLATKERHETFPRLSADELTIYFASATLVNDSDYDLYLAKRASLTEPFGAPIPLTTVNSTASESSPSVSSDGLSLWFTSDRAPDEGQHLYLATRTSTSDEFGAPTLASTVNASDSSVNDLDPFISADNNELWFVSNRTPGVGASDIWYATRTGIAFSAMNVEPLNSPLIDVNPLLSADGLTIYFFSVRAGGGVVRSHRNRVDDPFPPPTSVDELNEPTTAPTKATWLSPDGCRIYGATQDTGSLDIYVATRSP